MNIHGRETNVGFLVLNLENDISHFLQWNLYKHTNFFVQKWYSMTLTTNNQQILNFTKQTKVTIYFLCTYSSKKKNQTLHKLNELIN